MCIRDSTFSVPARSGSRRGHGRRALCREIRPPPRRVWLLQTTRCSGNRNFPVSRAKMCIRDSVRTCRPPSPPAFFKINCWKIKHFSGRLCVRLWQETNLFFVLQFCPWRRFARRMLLPATRKSICRRCRMFHFIRAR